MGGRGLHPLPQGLAARPEEPPSRTPLEGLSPGVPHSPHLASTHLGDGTILLHEQGCPTMGRQGLPVIPAYTAEERVEDAPAPGLLRGC